MTISFSGVGSGLPIDTWITAFVKIEQDKVDALTTQQTALQKKQTTLTSLKSEYSSVQSATQTFTDSLHGAGSDIFSKVSVSASDTSVVTASVTQYSTPSSLELEVTSLASSTTKKSDYNENLKNSSSKLSTLGVTTSGNFEINGATINVTPDTTVDSLIYQINNSSTAGVKASLVKGRIVLQNKTTGTNEINVTGTDIVDGTHNFAQLLGLTETSTSRQSDKNTLLSTGSNTLSTLGVTKNATLDINGTTISLTPDMTLDSLVSTISNSAAGVTASLSDGRLTLTNKSGNTSPITFGSGNTDVNGSQTFSELLGFDNRLQFGTNAVYSINGEQKTATTNSLTSDNTGILGLSLNLLATTEGEPVTIDITRDYDSEQPLTALQTFVTAFNKIITDTDTNTDSQNSGVLSGESTLVSIRNNLRTMVTSQVTGSGTYKSLADIGVSTGEPGLDVSADTTQLTIDKDKFLAAYAKDPAAVKALLIGNNSSGTTTTGLMQELQTGLKSAIDTSNGYFTARNQSLSSQITNLGDKITKKQEYVTSYKTRITNQFNYMDQMIAKMNSQFSQMQQQLASIGVSVGSSSSSSSSS